MPLRLVWFLLQGLVLFLGSGLLMVRLMLLQFYRLLGTVGRERGTLRREVGMVARELGTVGMEPGTTGTELGTVGKLMRTVEGIEVVLLVQLALVLLLPGSPLGKAQWGLVFVPVGLLQGVVLLQMWVQGLLLLLPVRDLLPVRQWKPVVLVLYKQVVLWLLRVAVLPVNLLFVLMPVFGLSHFL